MTSATSVHGRDRDRNCHVSSHVHLTNCIHARNHTHMQQHNHGRRAAEAEEERSLMRDLVLLQRSRSLKDPSTSPPSWLSPSVVSALAKRNHRAKHESRSEIGRVSVHSSNLAPSKVAALELISDLDLKEEVTGKARGKRRRFKGVKRDRDLADFKENVSVSVNSSSQGAIYGKKHFIRDEKDEGEIEKIVCGIPWNWSRIHNKSKSILSCGLSNSKGSEGDCSVRKMYQNGLNLNGLNSNLHSCTSSDSEVLPLLVESSTNPYSIRNYSGEIGIFSDSDLASEATTRHKLKNRHKSLTQMYNPKTFKDIVGQSLAVQALSNAVINRKIGSVYVFYGPHGTGKTSCARVFAKALNCTGTDRLKPCDLCPSCVLHNLGKNRNIIEFGSLSNKDTESITDILDNFILLSLVSNQFRVLIFDDCDALPAGTWGLISRAIERANWRMVFIFVGPGIDFLPHGILTKCQKYFFPKLKENDIISVLQWVSNNEGLEADRDALKLIASRSDGSLRDAKMTLEQLGLLGQRISLSLVQQLEGIVSDEKLVDLLDLALSADTANTVKCLREITETGVDPTSLMSQLATVITDILAGSYVLALLHDGPHRKFFRHSSLTREETERLRRALKILSDTEKQLRATKEKMTWLTAALLQLAPDSQYTHQTHALTDMQAPPPVPVQCEIEEIEEIEEKVLEGTRKRDMEVVRQMSLVRGKVSLGQVLNRTRAAHWSRQKAMSIAEKLERENLRMEAKSRSLLCLTVPKIVSPKINKLRLRARKPTFSLSKLVICGRCCAREKP